jgi:hypothetical protein
MSAAAGAAAAAQSEQEGRSLFFACEFKQAARAFEKASAEQPDSARLHYWLGKSYARLAEVSSPLSAPKNARKARRNLDTSYRNHRYAPHSRKVALVLLLAGFCPAQSLAPPEALEGYLARSNERQPGCSDLVFWGDFNKSPSLGRRFDSERRRPKCRTPKLRTFRRTTCRHWVKNRLRQARIGPCGCPFLFSRGVRRNAAMLSRIPSSFRAMETPIEPA